MTVRRTEPDRRSRLIDVTLDLIAEAGVAGTSHRKIAARAGVPLGSMTYHFDGMDELLFAAFSRFAETIITRFEERLSAATTIDEAEEAVVSLIHDDLTGPRAARDRVLTFELYTLAAREPRFRAITHEWMRRSRVELERHFDPDTARQVDALIEGLTIHRGLDPEPPSRGLTEDAVARITARNARR
ncbi:TetR/AcrR family transcriptional regulator [Streptosporangium amethystogenes subsp. fukuiense]|uniref:TetR/AcrR family transcriptional regulator n=1 Tax=Streptosporangium amethystogenes subsp. fukuiense TaxID=698418 RepID=A0ABW2SS47_9ACTN